MLICIDAGHYLGTSGKRCLKSIDPAETREWTLNSRIADKLQKRISAYDCRTMRVDDPTGREDVSLDRRCRMANEAKADLYLSIHHNAGIHGGPGGGIVVYVAPGAQEQSRVVQEAVYRHTVAATGLRGNRARPTPAASLYVLKHTRMPAVLGEFGFMDSTTDTHIILTEQYADQVADGIVAALVEVYGLKEVEEMLDEKQIRRIVREEIAAVEAERAMLPADEWAHNGLEIARAKGITDGTRPKSYATRQEVAIMINGQVRP